MTVYALRRLLLAVPTLFGVSVLAFVLVALSPGDPALAVVGERATREEYMAERARQGLDDPMPLRYARWMGRVLQGDLGRSAKSRRLVVDEIRVRWPATAELAASALLFAATVGIVAGVTSATRRGSLLDQATMAGALAGVSMPIFWLGGLLLLAATSLEPTWPTAFRVSPLTDLPARTHFYVVDAVLAGRWDALAEVLRHLLLPAIALGTIPMAIIGRMTRGAMLEAMGQDFVRTARAKGLSPRVVHYRHALRNALVPVVTVVGLEFGHLLGGAIITEQIFSWPGLGNWILQGVQHRDQNVIQAGVLAIASAFVLINLAVDLLYCLIDPRIRHS